MDPKKKGWTDEQWAKWAAEVKQIIAEEGGLGSTPEEEAATRAMLLPAANLEGGMVEIQGLGPADNEPTGPEVVTPKE